MAELVEEFEKSHPGHSPCSPQCRLRGYLHVVEEQPTDENWSIQCHFMGHLLDAIAGDRPEQAVSGTRAAIPQDGIEDELRYVYNDLNNPILGALRGKGKSVDPEDDPRLQGCAPESFGCHGREAEAELMAEAFRAYMLNPNYMKTVAPDTAKRIRNAVNPHPRLRYVIQFN